jgi:hypothetical protein
VYWPFLPDRNVPIECNSDESHTPGTFCVKITKQGPRGFICNYLLSTIYLLLNRLASWLLWDNRNCYMNLLCQSCQTQTIILATLTVLKMKKLPAGRSFEIPIICCFNLFCNKLKNYIIFSNCDKSYYKFYVTFRLPFIQFLVS